ncbi:MAG: hypothetical protein PUG67_05515 [Peptoniphilaceae bacterium]|nr:hypothetical protein [Peptoniphilaceae bacterium]MDY6018368.1 hypothetical protein [Anaerococcus sp.]
MSKNILIIAETGISSKLFLEKFENFLNYASSNSKVELTSLNDFVENLDNEKYTNVLLAPNAHVLEVHVKDYLNRVKSDAKVSLISEKDYMMMNVEKIVIDLL